MFAVNSETDPEHEEPPPSMMVAAVNKFAAEETDGTDTDDEYLNGQEFSDQDEQDDFINAVQDRNAKKTVFHKAKRTFKESKTHVRNLKKGRWMRKTGATTSMVAAGFMKQKSFKPASTKEL